MSARFWLVGLALVVLAISLNASPTLRIIGLDTSSYPVVTGNLHVDIASDSLSADIASSYYIIVDKSIKTAGVWSAPLDTAKNPVNTLVCVDVSGSMTAKQLQDIRGALNLALEEKSPGSRYAVADFGREFIVKCDFTDELETIQQAINSISRQTGNTYLHYNLDRALQYLAKQNPGGITSIVVISDGKEEVRYDVVSQKDKDELISTALRHNVPIHAIGFSSDRYPDYAILDYYSSKTNGIFIPLQGNSGLGPAVESLIGADRKIRSFGFTVLDHPGDGKEHEIKLQTQSGSTQLSAIRWALFPDNGKVWRIGFWHDLCRNKKLFYGSMAGLLVLLWLLAMIIRSILRRKKQAETESEPATPIPLDTEVDAALPTSLDEIKSTAGRAESIDRTVISTNQAGKPISGDYSILKLQFIAGPMQGKVFTISQVGVTLGRSPESGIQFTESTVSRNHAKIEYADGEFYLQDLNSANGTFVNDKKVDRCKLQHNDYIKIGTSEGTFLLA